MNDDLLNVILPASYNGRLKLDEGILSATRPNNSNRGTGRDLYRTAKVTFYKNTNDVDNPISRVVLKVNNTIVESSSYHQFVMACTAGVDGTSIVGYEFRNIGHKITDVRF